MKNEPKTMKRKHRSHLRLIEGGLKEKKSPGGAFVMAEATNTRLMGVVGLHTCYRFDEDLIHQFFYFDSEEYSFEDYNGFVLSSASEEENKSQVESTKSLMFGALGGEWVSLTEREALYLIGYYTAFNLEKDLEFPDGSDEYLWLVDASKSMDGPDLTALMEKICVRIRGHYELVNYYLMRCCGKDLTALRYLCTPDGMNDVINASSPATLYKNDIRETDEKNAYRCESLVETDDEFACYVTIVSVDGGKVTSSRLVSTLPISPWEASLILSRPEYIIHGKYDGDKEAFYEMMKAILPAFTQSSYPEWDLYFIYQTDNSHVKSPNYRLDMDTLAIVIAMDSGELVISGKDPNTTAGTAKVIRMAMDELCKDRFQQLGCYQFPEAVLPVFMDNGFSSFSEFLEFVQDMEGEDN